MEFKDIDDFTNTNEYYIYLDNLIIESIKYEKKLIHLLDECIDGYTYNCARLIFYLYKNKYVCGKLKNKLWFMFNKLKWQQTELGPYKELSTNILYLFERYKKIKEKEYNEIINNKENYENINIKSEEEYFNVFFEKIDNLILKLKNVNFKENVCKECLYLFYDDTFIHKLDKKYNLICFSNGILDIRSKSFRLGQKDDYISLSIDINYEQSNIENINNTIEKFIEFRNKILIKRKPVYLF